MTLNMVKENIQDARLAKSWVHKKEASNEKHKEKNNLWSQTKQYQINASKYSGFFNSYEKMDSTKK